MSKEYELIGDGWEDVPRSLDLACCDCSLVHSIVFRVQMKEGEPQLQWKVDRNGKATGALRRAKTLKRKRRTGK